ncbi:PIN domain-containing protein [Roseateles sp. DC23W]|uniref:Ribonuclease VapC n=1 Tax=Pelomonas dachongensis TaxID=3299029 RepID=A0ABW7EKQ9_9BURK
MKNSLSPAVFFDTNVLVYVASADPQRSARAGALLREGGIVSVQVLNELVSVLRRKFRFDWESVETVLAVVHAHCDVLPLDMLMHQEALLLARLHQLPWYDALIVAAAQRAGAHTLYTEDMQRGRAFDGLRLVNPFEAA